MPVAANLRVETELGVEKKCPVCNEYWPEDTDFFYPDRHTKTGFTCRCIACQLETRRQYQEKKHPGAPYRVLRR